MEAIVKNEKGIELEFGTVAKGERVRVSGTTLGRYLVEVDRPGMRWPDRAFVDASDLTLIPSILVIEGVEDRVRGMDLADKLETVFNAAVGAKDRPFALHSKVVYCKYGPVFVVFEYPDGLEVDEALLIQAVNEDLGEPEED